MNNTEVKPRVRFAPSPTGYMHVGNFRTALYNYLFAKKHGGDFLIRIEDTDQGRFVEGAVEKLLVVMDTMGLHWNEGPFLDGAEVPNGQKIEKSLRYPGIVEAGNAGPYIQSERSAIYQEYARELVRNGHAYYCFCQPERLDSVRKKRQQEKLPPMYDRYCLENLSEEQINENLKKNCPATIRLKVPKDETIIFTDAIRGKVSFNTNTIDDQVLIKSDGLPTYHLANVVDDHLMGITHVIRGEDWLPSTPKHILLYRALGWDIPQFAHLPLLLNGDRSKLSKRQGDVAVEDYLEKGYLKEAVINFVALLGWNPGKGSTQEVFSLEELIAAFDVAHVHKAGAVFDLKKLDWINAQYIKKLSLDDLIKYVKPYLEQKDFFIGADAARKDDGYLKKVLAIEQQRLSVFSYVGEENRFFFEDVSVEKEMLRWKEIDDAGLKKSLENSHAVLAALDAQAWELQSIERALLEAAGENRGELLWPLRVALTGAQKSPSPFEVAWVLGKEETIRRIQEALARI